MPIRLADVSTFGSTHNASDGLMMDLENFGQCLRTFPCRSSSSDGTNVIVGQFASHQSFTRGIEHVLKVSAEEEMIGADARFVVAMVANLHSLRDRTEVEFPGNAGGPLSA